MCWGKVFIRARLSIFKGGVVEMLNLITKFVEAYSIIAGNPAKTIIMRFDHDTITFLLESKWWDCEESKHKEQVKLFNNDNEFKRLLSQ